MSQDVNPSKITPGEDFIEEKLNLSVVPGSIYYGPIRFVIYIGKSFHIKEVLYNPEEYFKNDFYIKIQRGKCPLKKLKVAIWIDGVLYSKKNDGGTVIRHIGALKDGSVIEVKLDGAAGGFAVVTILGALKDDVIADVDGNFYKTVNIGGQIWMAENLRTTRYNDGTDIPYKTYGDTYRWYNDDVNYKKPYGALYRYEAGATGKLAPTGWHIPSVDEWNQLRSYLQSTGGQTGKALASKAGWACCATPGTVGNDQPSNNRCGFNGLPAGAYNYSHPRYFGLGDGTFWMTSTKDIVDPYLICMRYDSDDTEQHLDSQPYALSARCVKD